MEINTVSIVGLGALGVMFGNHLSKNMPHEALRMIADSNRIERYGRDNIYCNSEPCTFNYVSSDENVDYADLLIFAVKFKDLQSALNTAKKQVGPNTVIMSLLNGISSEEIIGQTVGSEHMIYSTAQGMDAVKIENKLTYQHMGNICFGSLTEHDEKVDRVARFFDKTDLPYEIAKDIRRKLWGKFMLNVGINQSAAVYGCGYGGLQENGEARETAISAMKEVIALSEKEGINLTMTDLNYWLSVLDAVSPQGKPSMQQDMEAKRLSEVGLFSGTVLELGKKHKMTFPTNQMLHDRIESAESKY